MLGGLRKLALGISADEASFNKRGFVAADPRTCLRLERVGRNFIQGYLTALEAGRPHSIAKHLEQIQPEFRGFAYEGAAMGFALLDGLTPWRTNRTAEFINGPARDHVYMAHVGVGWALARLPHLRRRRARFMARFDPLLRWLILDGYGFHQGYFYWRNYFLEYETLETLSTYERRVFDQGLGRCLWFVAGGDAARAVSLIAAFPPPRHCDLWSGLGLACTYAGGADPDALAGLCAAAGEFLPHLQQGAAFAAKARERAGNPSAETDQACQVLCGMSAPDAAAISDESLEDLPPDGAEPAYEAWRVRIQTRFAASGRRSESDGELRMANCGLSRGNQRLNPQSVIELRT